MGKRAETVINLAKDIIKQDPGAKIIVGGDLNGQMNRMHTFLTIAGFTPALRERTKTHRDGNQLDQLWTRNLTITNAIVADPIDQVSDHCPIQVKMEAEFIAREQVPQQHPGDIDLRTLPQTTIRKVIKECVEKGLFDSNPFIDSRPLIDYVP